MLIVKNCLNCHGSLLGSGGVVSKNHPMDPSNSLAGSESPWSIAPGASGAVRCR
ncbi:MAG: hypothetical protein VCD50_02260 [Alphaproteobacteria bacterium]